MSEAPCWVFILLLYASPVTWFSWLATPIDTQMASWRSVPAASARTHLGPWRHPGALMPVQRHPGVPANHSHSHNVITLVPGITRAHRRVACTQYHLGPQHTSQEPGEWIHQPCFYGNSVLLSVHKNNRVMLSVHNNQVLSHLSVQRNVLVFKAHLREMWQTCLLILAPSPDGDTLFTCAAGTPDRL